MKTKAPKHLVNNKLPALRLRSPLGVALERYRRAKGLGLNELARKAKVDPAQLSRLEGASQISAHATTLRKLAKALDMDIELLMRLNAISRDHEWTTENAEDILLQGIAQSTNRMSKSDQTNEESNSNQSIGMVVIDKQIVFRLGLRMYLLTALREIEWLGEADTLKAGLTLVERTQPDLVLIDAFLDNEDIGDVLSRIKEKCRNCRIVVLAAIFDSLNFEVAMSSGADSYFLKTLPPDRMVSALRTVLKGQKWIQPNLVQHIHNESIPNIGEVLPLGEASFTPRQLEVLRLIAQGLRSAEIADRLTISEQTVKTHTSYLLKKLGSKQKNWLLRRLMLVRT